MVGSEAVGVLGVGVEAASEIVVASALLRFFFEDLRSALVIEEVDIVVFRSGEKESRVLAEEHSRRCSSGLK